MSGCEGYDAIARVYDKLNSEIDYTEWADFFESCFDKIKDFKRDEAIIVGDSLSSDIQGGINAGIKTCHFNPKGIEYKDIRPDYSISDLSELIPLLDQIK